MPPNTSSALIIFVKELTQQLGPKQSGERALLLDSASQGAAKLVELERRYGRAIAWRPRG